MKNVTNHPTITISIYSMFFFHFFALNLKFSFGKKFALRLI